MSDIKQLAYKKAISDNLKSNLFAFSKYLLNYKDITERTHGELIQCLERDSKRKLIVMPRGTFKSSIACVAYPIWLLLRNPNETILIESEVYVNAKNFLREIKAHLLSPKMTTIFGEFQSDLWNESEINIKQRTHVTPQANITIGSMGKVKVGQHYQIIINDDMNSANNSDTPEMRQKVINHYQLNVAILNPGGTYIVVGTRYAVDDLIGNILENEVNNANQSN